MAAAEGITIRDCSKKIFKDLDDAVKVALQKEASKKVSADMKNDFSFYKEHESDKVWWVDFPDDEGTYAFSFDKKRIFYLFGDYPGKLTKEELEIFNKENPFWMDFFSG